MKFTQKYIRITTTVIGLTLLNACAEKFQTELTYPEDITFNEITLDRFSYDIYDAPFDVGDNASGIITVNVSKASDGSYSGFALSNKNYRSYPWELTPKYGPIDGLTPAEKQAAINTTAFSVLTDEVNRTENYLVGNTNNENAFFTLSTPSTIEHVLIANTTYNYLLASYGSIYSEDLDPETQMYLLDGGEISNPYIESTERETVYTLPAPDGTLNAIRLEGVQQLDKDAVGIPAGEAAGEAALAAALLANPNLSTYRQGLAYDNAYDDAYEAATSHIHRGYVKLTIEGFLNGATTGTVDVYLSLLEGVDPENPDFVFHLIDWRKVDLTSLGDVDKVLFNMSSDYVDGDGKMVYPPTFCLDGIRIQP